MRKRGSIPTNFDPSTGSNGVGEDVRDRALWLAVINQQIEDATTVIFIKDPNRRKAQELQRQQARSWLLLPNADFYEVCALAEVDPDDIRRVAGARIDAFDAESPASNVRHYTYDGKTLVLSEWARLSGLPVRIIKGRINHGWSIGEAIGAIPRHKKTDPALYTHNGKTLALKQWAERTGITLSTITSRLRKGWSFERTITTTPDRRRAGSRPTFGSNALSPGSAIGKAS